VAPVVIAAATVVAAGCSAGGSDPIAAAHGRIVAVGAENEYANVISQIGGKYVSASAVESNPNTDPHTFEASASVSQTVGAARLVVQNGIGYDTYMNRIDAASPNAKRKVIIVQKLLGVPDSAPNPHLWYSPATMPAVARAVAKELSALQPEHARYFRANQARFLASLRPWLRAIAAFKARYSSTPVAVTEPVGDYLLQAMGTRDLTPFGLQADVMNGVDLPAQYVSLEETLLNDHKVKVFVYNQQVVDSVTQLFLATAHRAGVPVVGVYETMPTPGYSYQSWMLAEVHALQRAVAEKTSTEKL
jgi:zinc/manganese transport system substrate-binding protein